MATEADCQFIHRPPPSTAPAGAVTQVQCPACGSKFIIYDDEDHRAIEALHRNHCRVRAAQGEERTYG